MSYYAQTIGKHCMQVILERSAKIALEHLKIPTDKVIQELGKGVKEQQKPYWLYLFGLKCKIVSIEGTNTINGLRLSEWLKSGITEEQAKSVMELRGADVLKKCSWGELWEAYRK